MPEHINAPRQSASSAAQNAKFRLFRLSLLAALIGLFAGVVAFVLVSLIGLISNLVFYQRIGTEIPDLSHRTLGPLVIVVPVIGGLIIGLLARYGTPKIRGHGIAEAMEAVLVNRSRI